MENEYKIGNHSFDDEAEYHKAMKDYEYIRRFQEELDLTQPNMARALYERVKSSKNLFRTSIGEAFQDKLVQNFIQQMILKKKEKMDDKQNQSFREMLNRALEHSTFSWYWGCFRLVQAYLIAHLLLLDSGFITSCISTEQGLSLFLKLYAFSCILSQVFVWGLIFVSILLLGYFFVERLLRKSGITHCINLVLMSGLFLCIELCFLT